MSLAWSGSGRSRSSPLGSGPCWSRRHRAISSGTASRCSMSRPRRRSSAWAGSRLSRSRTPTTTRLSMRRKDTLFSARQANNFLQGWQPHPHVVGRTLPVGFIVVDGDHHPEQFQEVPLALVAQLASRLLHFSAPFQDFLVGGLLALLIYQPFSDQRLLALQLSDHNIGVVHEHPDACPAFPYQVGIFQVFQIIGGRFLPAGNAGVDGGGI